MTNYCAFPSLTNPGIFGRFKTNRKSAPGRGPQHHGFEVVSSDADPDSILGTLQSSSIDVIIVSSTGGHSGTPEMATLRMLQTSNPQIPKVALNRDVATELGLRVYRQQISVSDIRQARYLQPRRTRALCVSSWRSTGGSVGSNRVTHSCRSEMIAGYCGSDLQCQSSHDRLRAS